MRDIGRNDLCPCGSGKKFKKCHLGREDELNLEGPETPSIGEMGARIVSLPMVSYGRSRQISDALNLKELTGKEMEIRFLDLGSYAQLDFFGESRRTVLQGKGGGVFVNPYKTAKADPANLYIAISESIDDSTLAHELAHALAYLGDSGHVPGTLDVVGYELGIPVDHLEHPEEFGHWLDYLRTQFDVRLDADDTIILYLYQHGMLIKSKEIKEQNGLVLRAKSDRMFRFLSENNEVIDSLVKSLPGYIGPRLPKD